PCARRSAPTLVPYTTLFRSVMEDRRTSGPASAADSPDVGRGGTPDTTEIAKRDCPAGDARPDQRRRSRYRRDRECDRCETSHRRSEEHTSELQSRGHLVCRL